MDEHRRGWVQGVGTLPFPANDLLFHRYLRAIFSPGPPYSPANYILGQIFSVDTEKFSQVPNDVINKLFSSDEVKNNVCKKRLCYQSLNSAFGFTE